jgi:hypothetical protein
VHEPYQRVAAVVLKFASLVLQRTCEPLQGPTVVPHIAFPATAVGQEFSKRGVSFQVVPLSCNGDNGRGRG